MNNNAKSQQQHTRFPSNTSSSAASASTNNFVNKKAKSGEQSNPIINTGRERSTSTSTEAANAENTNNNNLQQQQNTSAAPSVADANSVPLTRDSSTEAQSSPTKPLQQQQSQHWSMRDKVINYVQTEKYDAMRKMLLLFDDVCQSVRAEVVTSEGFAREKLSEWEKLYRMNIWRWDAALEVVCDAEGRARDSLLEAERMWREDFFQDIFELEMKDV